MDSKLYLVCLELVQQRGYTLFEQLPDRIGAIKPDGSVFYILLLNIAQFNVNGLIRCSSVMKELEVNHVLVTYQDRASSQAVKAIERMSQGLPVKADDSQRATQAMTIELFLEENLQFNITKHELQPRFERLSTSEATEFKKHWMKYETMKLNDPIARFYNYVKGDVIRVIRKNGLISYRMIRT